MLRKFTIKKILISSSALLTLFLLYLVPSNSYKLSNVKQELEYVNSNLEKGEVYLLDKNNMLSRSIVTFNTKEEDVEKRATEIINYLILESENESKIPSGFKAYIPSSVKLNSILYENNVLKVDFNDKLLDVSKNMEEKVVEGLVYSLTTIGGVDKIIIYINGDILINLPQNNITLPPSLDRSYGINKSYDITSYKGVNKVTVYYTQNYNDNIYYVPVTKYINDDRDKISIIIEELAGANIANTNLMSYLNNNTKLMSYSLTNEEMNLVFNNYIFDNIDEKSILEEVIYTISLSVADNYEVEEVSFQVENEEIYKSVLKSIE